MSRVHVPASPRTLAGVLSRARKTKLMSPIQLAMKSGVSIASIYSIERGATKEPFLLTLHRLVLALELEPAAIAKLVPSYSATEIETGKRIRC